MVATAVDLQCVLKGKTSCFRKATDNCCNMLAYSICDWGIWGSLWRFQ